MNFSRENITFLKSLRKKYDSFCRNESSAADANFAIRFISYLTFHYFTGIGEQRFMKVNTRNYVCSSFAMLFLVHVTLNNS